MEVTYRVQRGDLWRVARCGYTSHPQIVLYLLFPIFTILLNVSTPLLRGDFLEALWTVLWPGSGLALTCFVFIAFTVYRRMPSKHTERFCTERIGPDGFECVTPERHHYAAWQDVIKIKETTQDFFFFAKKGKSIILPKRVFDNPAQAQEFLRTAMTYWNNAKSGLTPFVQEGIWPPAPRSADSQELGEKPKR